MQFLDDDSNEWMRKAAEDFPVKPFGMNWEAVAKELHHKVPEKRAMGMVLLRYAAMIAFFLLLSLVCNKYIRMDFESRYNAHATQNSKHADKELVKRNESSRYVNENTQAKDKKGETVVNDHFAVNTLLEQSNELNIKNGAIETKKLNGVDYSVINTIPLRQKEIIASTSLKDLPLLNTIEKNRDVKDDSKESDSKTGKSKKVIDNSRRLYMGLLVGPDISSVKFQRTDGVGYNLGFLLGYRINDKLQVESGVLYNRKSYNSSGEYFNAEKAYLPTHSYVTNVNGYCNMFEVPVHFRYNIQQKQQTTWFATTGISSYLMNKEDYNYTYNRYNVTYSGSKIFKNASKDWLTTLNASIGFEKAINKKLQLRVEPYYKMPLKGMGIGKLPISSAGMNIGVSYPIK